MQFAASQLRIGNTLIESLPADERNLLLNSAKAIQLEAEQPIYEFEDQINWIYFPLDSVFSTSSLMEDGSSAEICLTGNEGIVGISAAFDAQTARNWTSVLIGGRALRIETTQFHELATSNETLQLAFLNFYRQLMTQISQRAVCNGRHTLLQRFCFWLLLVCERAKTEEIPLTHEIIARKLGARRAGITNVAGALQESGAISYSRGVIHINNREILEKEVCECFRAVNEFKTA